MNINRIYLNLRQMSSKNYAIFWGGGGEVIKRSHWITGGRGGGQDGPKKDRIIFKRSLTLMPVDRPNAEYRLLVPIMVEIVATNVVVS